MWRNRARELEINVSESKRTTEREHVIVTARDHERENQSKRSHKDYCSFKSGGVNSPLAQQRYCKPVIILGNNGKQLEI